MTQEELEQRRQDEAKRRRDAYDAERERRWKQQMESDDPPEYDPWTESYF